MNKKVLILNIIMYISFFIIISRIYYLQIIKYDYYQEKLLKITNKEVLGDTMPRGKIYDKNGNLLVDNTLIKTIYYKNDYNLNTNEEIKLAYYIKDYINIDYSKLTNSYLKDFYILTNDDLINKRVDDKTYNDYQKRKITDQEFYQIKKNLVTEDDLNIYDDSDKQAIYIYYLMNNGYSYDDKIIKTDASDLEFAWFCENNHNLLGFNTKYTYKRYYYYGDTFKSILGNVGNISSENKNYYLNKGYNLNDTVGLSNIEYIYDDYLKGEKEVYKIINNEKILVKDGKVGNDLYLTIDINLQKYIDSVLDNELKSAKKSINTKYLDRSYVTITNPNDGSILAMSGRVFKDDETYDYNIGTITDTMTPGSVVKGISMLVGYNENIIKIGEHMQDECIKIKATPKKCSIYTMGYINDLEALYKSSNVYQFKIALKLGGVKYQYDKPAYINDNVFNIYRDYFKMFGLGVKTGIELLNESIGYSGKNSNAGLLMNFAIGQYDTYTNLQLNQYISTLANGKNRYKMHLIDKIKNDDQTIYLYQKEILNTINTINVDYINRVKLGLKLVMERGTGYNYINLENKPSGKTGTSETFIDSNFDSKYETETISTSFVGYMPNDNPNMAISITTPNISYVNNYSDYIYPFNKNVIKKITNNYYNIIN